MSFGAMGAHALKTRIDASHLQVFETAVKYQMYHTLALLGLVPLFEKFSVRHLNVSAWLFIIGIVLFSGSLYVLSMRQIVGISGCDWVGIITPFGGLAFILGWIFALIAIVIPPAKR